MRKYLDEFRSLPAAALRAWERDGGRGVWGELRLRTLDRLYRRWTALVLELDALTAPEPAPPDGVEVRALPAAEWRALAELADEYDQRLWAAASARGRSCLMAWRGARPVGFVWMSPAVEPEIERCRLPLPPDAVYLWNVYVHRAERGRGIGAALYRAVLDRTRREGRRRAWTVIEPSNRASLHAARNAVAQEPRIVGVATFTKLLRSERYRYRPDPMPRSDARTAVAERA